MSVVVRYRGGEVTYANEFVRRAAESGVHAALARRSVVRMSDFRDYAMTAFGLDYRTGFGSVYWLMEQVGATVPHPRYQSRFRILPGWTDLLTLDPVVRAHYYTDDEGITETDPVSGERVQYGQLALYGDAIDRWTDRVLRVLDDRMTVGLNAQFRAA